ncbi:hypothetical protein QVD17_05052 [Tagetes erecta]|uniref:Uncharacterized protein n=1 Tax=Tagetes erecta TaxID=13708 RepID=A0AAD8LHG2_TARER|nr:hypothetical protein QVD17_05052 [Tagetes erecta]
MASLPLFSSSPSRTCHIRSISFPTRSHHNVVQVEEELKNLKAWETSMSSVPTDAETFCTGLTCLERLYTCLDNLLNSHTTQQALSHYQHEKLVDELLVRSMKLLDVCGSVKDVVSQVKEHVRDIQSAQRRRKEDLSIDASVLRKLKKNAKKAVTELKQINQIYCAKAMNVEKHVSWVIMAVRDVSEVSVFVFGMLLLFMSVFISKLQSSSKWSVIGKIIPKGRLSGSKHDHQVCVEALDFHVEGIENGLAPVFRRLISTRASLLNIQSN